MGGEKVKNANVGNCSSTKGNWEVAGGCRKGFVLFTFKMSAFKCGWKGSTGWS